MHEAINQKERTIGINPFCAFCVIMPSAKKRVAEGLQNGKSEPEGVQRYVER